MSTNDPQQQRMIGEAMKAIAERRPGRTKLVYDKSKRTIVAVTDNNQAPRALNITADDADMFAVITVSAQWIRDAWPRLSSNLVVSARFTSWDDDDAFSQCDLGPLAGPTVMECAIALSGVPISPQTPLRVELAPVEARDSANPSIFVGADGSHFQLSGYRRLDDHDECLDAVVVEVQPALDARRKGLLETSLLRDRSVLCFGLGTGGAHAAIELAKSGVGSFTLVDPDRLSVGNVVRHPGGISQVGRLKVKVVRDLILEKNPEAKVAVHPFAIDAQVLDVLRPLVREANVVICGTDNRPSKLLINQLCIEANTVAVYGGAFRRAYGGQVLRVRPRQSPCHQCFIDAMPDEAADVEISSVAEAEAVAYSDRPVAVEPGLSLDVVPIANFLTKLALLELLVGKPSTLDSLKRDFDAPWYLWLNRPEPGTPYAAWPPLSESSDEMTINRWYGIYFDRDLACPACGDFVSATAGSYGFDLDTIALPSRPSKD